MMAETQKSNNVCPNCGQSVRDGLAVCAFCGADMVTGQVPFPFDNDARKVSSGAALGLFLTLLIFFGIGISTAMHNTIMYTQHRRDNSMPPPDTWPAWAYAALPGVPLVVNVVLYFAVRRRAPLYGRGLLYSVFVTLALSLGAFAVCR